MKRWIGIAIGGAAACAFLPPFLSNVHRCPVLQQREAVQGQSAQAIPAFARKYNVDCTYCHTAWPQLNRTGYVFRRLGYRMPYEVPTHGVPQAKAPSKTGTTTASGQVPPAVNSGLKNAVAEASKLASPEKIAEGGKLFTEMQCFTCHVNGGNVIDPSKPIKGANFAKKYPDDAQIAHIIRQGVAGTAMPAYGKDRLSDDQLSALVAYIRSLTP